LGELNADMKILAPCTHCHGEGKSPLEGPLLECYEAVKRIGPASASEIHKAQKVDMHITASHQRLKRLSDLGMVRQAEGKWSVV